MAGRFFEVLAFCLFALGSQWVHVVDHQQQADGSMEIKQDDGSDAVGDNTRPPGLTVARGVHIQPQLRETMGQKNLRDHGRPQKTLRNQWSTQGESWGFYDILIRHQIAIALCLSNKYWTIVYGSLNFWTPEWSDERTCGGICSCFCARAPGSCFVPISCSSRQAYEIKLKIDW